MNNSPQGFKDNYITQLLITAECTIELIESVIDNQTVDLLKESLVNLTEKCNLYRRLFNLNTDEAEKELTYMWNSLYKLSVSALKDYYYKVEESIKVISNYKSIQHNLLSETVYKVCLEYITQYQTKMLNYSDIYTGRKHDITVIRVKDSYYKCKSDLDSLFKSDTSAEEKVYSMIEAVRLQSVQLRTIAIRGDLFYPHYSILPNLELSLAPDYILNKLMYDFNESLKRVSSIIEKLEDKVVIIDKINDCGSYSQVYTSYSSKLDELMKSTSLIFNPMYIYYRSTEDDISKYHDKASSKVHEVITKDKSKIDLNWIDHYKKSVTHTKDSQSYNIHKLRRLDRITEATLNAMYSKENLREVGIDKLKESVYLKEKESNVNIEDIINSISIIVKTFPSAIYLIENNEDSMKPMNTYIHNKSTNKHGQDMTLNYILDSVINMTLFPVEGLSNSREIYNSIELKESCVKLNRLAHTLGITRANIDNSDLVDVYESLKYIIPNANPLLVESILNVIKE